MLLAPRSGACWISSSTRSIPSGRSFCANWSPTPPTRCDRRRFEALTDPKLAPPAEAKIRVVPDKQARTLLIADDGIGMSRQELIDNLGTIARSGTRAFGAETRHREARGPAQPDRPVRRRVLLGVHGRRPGRGHIAQSRLRGGLHLGLGRRRRSSPWRRPSASTPAPTSCCTSRPTPRNIWSRCGWRRSIRKWADHITLPITVARDGKDQTANEGTALWRKSKSDVSEQNLQGILSPPRAFLRRAVGDVALARRRHAGIFLPAVHPRHEAVRRGGQRPGSHVRLHVRRMFITDKAELLPHWLRFVSGVVDTEDLPLNVSREMLQTTPVLGAHPQGADQPRAGRTEERAPRMPMITRSSGRISAPIMKEGVWEDAEHRAEIVPLLRFHSSTQEGWTSLPDYVSRMQEGQDTIYYLSGDNVEAMKTSPQLEGFRAKGIEVLLMSDPIDNFWPERLDSFEDKKLRSVTQAAGEFGKDDVAAGYFRAAGGDEGGAGRRRGRRARHRPADRQRRRAGGRRARVPICRCSA